MVYSSFTRIFGDNFGFTNFDLRLNWPIDVFGFGFEFGRLGNGLVALVIDLFIDLYTLPLNLPILYLVLLFKFQAISCTPNLVLESSLIAIS